MNTESNERIGEALASIAEKAEGGLTQLVEMFQREFPLLAEEILSWHLFVAAFWSILGLLLVVGGAIFTRRCYKFAKKQWVESKKPKSDDCSALANLIIIPTVLPGLAIIACHYQWLQILIAPRLFLLEYVSEFLGL